MASARITTGFYGITKKNNYRNEKIDIEPRHDDEGIYKSSEPDGHGNQNEAGPYHTDRADSSFKDTRKWRAETKEQAQ